MKVGQRLTLGFLIYSLLLCIIGFVFLSNRQKVTQLYNKVSTEIIPKRTCIKNIKIKSRRMLSETYTFLISKNIDKIIAKESEASFYQAKREEEEWEEKYKKIVRDNSTELQFAKDIHAVEEEIKKFCLELFIPKQNQLSENELASIIKKIVEQEDKLFAIIDRAIEYDSYEFEKGDLALRYSFSHSKRMFLILITVSVTFVLSTWVFITRGITIPIKKIKDAMVEVGKGKFEIRVGFKSKDELGFLADGFNSMVTNLQTKITSIVNLNREVSERKKAEEKVKIAYLQLKQAQNQLIQSAKMASIGQLAGGVAHEVNNPLTSVLNNVQMLRENIEEGKSLDMPELKIILGEMEESGLRCKKIVESLLGFSRISEWSLKPNSINEIAEKAITVIGQQLELENITIQKQFQPDLPQIKGDYQYLQQAIFNIIVNAKDAIQARPEKEGGSIIIQTQYQPKENLVLVSISDNGIGIPKELLGRIFEPFFTTKPPGKGTGLGLSIVHNIIERHNAGINVASEINKGTTFKITLPCA